MIPYYQLITNNYQISRVDMKYIQEFVILFVAVSVTWLSVIVASFRPQYSTAASMVAFGILARLMYRVWKMTDW